MWIFISKVPAVRYLFWSAAVSTNIVTTRMISGALIVNFHFRSIFYFSSRRHDYHFNTFKPQLVTKYM